MSTPFTAVAGDSQSSALITAKPLPAMKANRSEISLGERVRWFGRGMFSDAAETVGAAGAAAGAAGAADAAGAFATAAAVATTAAAAATTAATAATTAAAAAATAATAANAASAATAAAVEAVSAATTAASTAATAAATAAKAAATAAAAADAASAATAAAAEAAAAEPATAANAATVSGDVAGAGDRSPGPSTPLGSRFAEKRNPALPVAASATSDDIARGWVDWSDNDEPVSPAAEQPNLLEWDSERIPANQGLLGRLEPVAGDLSYANHDGDLLAAGSEHSFNSDEYRLPDRAVDSEAYLADVDDSDYGEPEPVPERFYLAAPVSVLGSSPPIRAPGRRGREPVQGRAPARRRLRDGRSASPSRSPHPVATPFPSSSSSSSSAQGWEATWRRFRDRLSSSPTPHPRYKLLAPTLSGARDEGPDLPPYSGERGNAARASSLAAAAAATARSPWTPPPTTDSSSSFRSSSSSGSDVIPPGVLASPSIHRGVV